MPFQGDNPLGTAGGLDLFGLPQVPATFVIADGPMYVLIMRTNGTLTERNRENVEDVIRVIGLRGEALTGVIVRHTGGVVEANATDIDFDAGFSVGTIAPGVVVINIANKGITTAMIADGAISTLQLADLGVSLAKLAANSVDASKIVDGSVGTNELANLAVTLGKLAANSVDSSKIVDGSIATGDIANLAITSGKLAANALVNHVVYVTNSFVGSVTNASTVTWVNAVSINEILPAGTWEIDLLLTVAFIENTGTGCVASFRIGAPIVGASVTQSQTAADRTPVTLSATAASVVSDGVTPTAFTGEFLKASGGTPRVETASILAVCRRIS